MRTMLRHHVLRIALLLLLVLAGSPLQSQETPRQTPFDQGRMRLSGGGSTTTGFGSTYFVIGLGFGYFVLDGLELGLDTAAWLGSGPFVAQLSPQVQYILPYTPLIHPYVGTFYRHWFVGRGLPDIDTIGGRGGVIILPSQYVMLGGGLVTEYVLTPCDECVRVYPEIVLSFSF